jgi:hypothetical protein
VFTRLRSKLSQRQKSQIKFCLALFSLLHFRSFAGSANSGYSPKELFEKLSPVTTEIELVRLGGDLDGSYIVPLIDLEYDGVISPGVGQTFEFEKAIADSRCRVVLIDGTVEKPQNLPPEFVFLQKMLGISTNPEKNQISMKEVTNLYFPTSQSLVLQMDIEGGEYEVLNSLEEDDLIPFATILVEFHHLHKLNESPSWNSKIRKAVQVFERDFVLIHTHPNNAGGFFLWRFRKLPKVVETTWVKKSLVGEVRGQAKLPHPLDQRNDTLMEDLAFPTFNR